MGHHTSDATAPESALIRAIDATVKRMSDNAHLGHDQRVSLSTALRDLRAVVERLDGCLDGRSELPEPITSVVSATLEACEQALQGTSLPGNDRGSSIPLLISRLEDATKRFEIAVDIHTL
jgi:hypothetical protein